MSFEDEDDLFFEFETFLQTQDAEASALEGIPNSRLPGGGLSGAARIRDFKRGTVVCRHWLRGLCMKGETCEFLHQYDLEKMPECRWGTQCQVTDCPFRHVAEEDRVECIFYKQGFCVHGPICRYRHTKIAPEDCPQIADFSFQEEVVDEEGVRRKKTQPANEYFKTVMCKNWEAAGECPFGTECHFAHGKDELRPFPGDKRMKKGGDEAALEDLPDIGEGSNAYFIVKSFDYRNVLIGKERGVWGLSPELSAAFASSLGKVDRVFFILTVSASKHYQALLRVKSKTIIDNVSKEPKGRFNAPPSDREARDRTLPWPQEVEIEFLRIVELPFSEVVNLHNPMDEGLPVTRARNFQQLPNDLGHELVVRIYEESKVPLSWDDLTVSNEPEIIALERRKVAETESLNAPSLEGLKWPTFGPGFMFACNNHTVDEVFGRMIIGSTKEHEQQTKVVRPGMTLFIVNMADRAIMGIFQAISPMIVNLEPTAFTRGPNQQSPFPVQVRFSVVLEGKPIPETDEAVKEILGEKGIKLGQMRPELVQKLADLFAERCNLPVLSSDGAEELPKYTEKIPLTVDENDFQLLQRIRGEGDENLLRIEAAAGNGTHISARGRWRGKASDEKEPPHLLVETRSPGSLKVACGMVAEMLDMVFQEYSQFKMMHGPGGVFPPGPIPPPPMGVFGAMPLPPRGAFPPIPPRGPPRGPMRGDFHGNGPPRPLPPPAGGRGSDGPWRGKRKR